MAKRKLDKRINEQKTGRNERKIKATNDWRKNNVWMESDGGVNCAITENKKEQMIYGKKKKVEYTKKNLNKETRLKIMAVKKVRSWKIKAERRKMRSLKKTTSKKEKKDRRRRTEGK